MAFTHLVGLDQRELVRTFTDDEAAWRDLSQQTGVVPRDFFRPQFGRYDEALAEAARRRGLTIVLWSVDPEDWKRPGPEVVRDATLSRATGGSIVLLHTNADTVAALPSILTGLRSKGLRPTSVSTLLEPGS